MADDQNKSSTIDDLVKQLSNQSGQKPSVSAPTSSSMQPPSNLPGVKVENKPITPPISSMPPTRPSVSPPPINIPKPPTPQPVGDLPTQAGGLPQPPRPQIQIRPPVQPPKPPVQEYKSSIRTMGEDISSIKAGQKPAGIDIPRKVAPEMPKPPMPQVPKPAIPPMAGGSKPAIGLGRPERTGPLPTMPIVPKPAEMPKPPIIQPSITVPGERKGLSTTFYLLIVGILVIGAFLYWFFVLRISEPEVVVSPTPSPTLTPSVKSLSDVFEGSSVNFEISPENIGTDFKTFVNTLNVTKNQFAKINLVQKVQGTLVPVNFLEMFDMALIISPAGLKNNLLDSATLVYGQSEAFNKDGSVNLTAQNLKKTVFIARVSDRTAVETMMMDWELTIDKNLADYLLIPDTSKESSVNFLENVYRNASIRYKNFPYPDVTVDYTVVDSAGQSYLIISGSREAMYAAIDILSAQ